MPVVRNQPQKSNAKINLMFRELQKKGSLVIMNSLSNANMFTCEEQHNTMTMTTYMYV